MNPTKHDCVADIGSPVSRTKANEVQSEMCGGRRSQVQQGWLDHGFYSGSMEAIEEVSLSSDLDLIYIFVKITREQIAGK